MSEGEDNIIQSPRILGGFLEGVARAFMRGRIGPEESIRQKECLTSEQFELGKGHLDRLRQQVSEQASVGGVGKVTAQPKLKIWKPKEPSEPVRPPIPFKRKD